VGLPIFGPGRLLTANGAVSVYASIASQGSALSTIETWTVVATGIGVLITQNQGDRNGFGGDAQRTRMTVTGVDPLLGAPNVRFQITAYPTRPEMVGWFLRSEDSGVPHPAGEGGLLGQRIEVKCSQLDFPATNMA